MAELKFVNWSKFPKPLIDNICSNIKNIDLKQLRLTSKHWSKCVNSKLFTVIDKFVDKKSIILKYGNIVLKADNKHFGDEIITLLANNCKKLTYLVWELPLHLDALIKILNNCKCIQYISLRYNVSYEIDKIKLDNALNSILQLKSINKIRLGLYNNELLDLFFQIPQNYISKLNLKSYPHHNPYIISKLRAMISLRSVQMQIIHPLFPKEDLIRSPIASPSDFIVHKDIENVSVTVTDIRLTRKNDPIAIHLNNALISLFKNPYFVNLKSLEWQLKYPDFEPPVIFYSELPEIETKFTNLKLINLTVMDKFLLSFIVNSCPNLIDLRFSSLLTLPHNTQKLSSLNNLKRLLCKGFDEDVENYPNYICRLFPNISFVTMECIGVAPEVILKNTSFRVAFPKAKLVLVH